MIRPVNNNDIDVICAIHRAAFGGEDEATLVRRLHEAGRAKISLLLEQHGEPIGHVLFSPVTIEYSDDGRVLGLAPVAVLPAWQRQGFGDALIRAGIEAARNAGHTAIVVLGHTTYYPRFGFVPASQHDLHDVYGGGDAFMVLELIDGALQQHRGRVDYAPEFAELV